MMLSQQVQVQGPPEESVASMQLQLTSVKYSNAQLRDQNQKLLQQISTMRSLVTQLMQKVDVLKTHD